MGKHSSKTDDSTGNFTLEKILTQFREDARNNRDLGDRFERMMLRYFELDPLYADRFSRVWMWNDWPHKGAVGDVGIDLVAQERATGEYCAIQCKFYLPEHTLSKADIDSFFTAAGRDPFTSSIIVSTTDKWGRNAEDALNQTKKVIRIGTSDLEQSCIDWSKFDLRRPQDLTLRPKKMLRPHQTKALDDVLAGFASADRGKLIMACGTGKTFTALKIAERMAPGGHVLFLVPSLSLLAQTLREWTSEAEHPLHSLAVCSDANIGKSRKKNDDDTADITIHDLAFPATTSAPQLVAQWKSLRAAATRGQSPFAVPGEQTGTDPLATANRLTVVFSTYQSIEAVSRAQRAGLPEFDLIICDEAHRTTGVTLVGEDESHFVKVHDANFLKARKRLYMTATPRLYGDTAKGKAKQENAELCSMDDASLFGEEFHRLGFGEAVGGNLLTDYKVLILAVDEKYVAKEFQKQLADKTKELNLDDAARITGCWNGLAKRFEALAVVGDDPAAGLAGDLGPMRRAVAFSRSITNSEAFVEQFRQILSAYRETHPDDDTILNIEAEHVDGTFDALRRGARLEWLKAESPPQTCRILSNARCLSEGVDVPALDAVLFLNPRKSVIDVVQSVGRVMRRAPGKRFGYIILPIGIPADTRPEDALKDNEKYKVVWQVLQALRAHDDRFNATINQLELNRDRPQNINVIGVAGSEPGDGAASGDAASPGDSQPKLRHVQAAFAFPDLEEWKDAIYAKIVLKCGDRAYWETWARDIAAIAERHIARIQALLDDPASPHAQAFADFLSGLQHNLNPAVTRDDAIEMLAQHQITKPVFDALFANYQFTAHNPVSQSMQKMLELLHEQALEKEAVTLEKFYASVRDRAKGLDNAEARQRVVIELYNEFFRAAFPRMAERLGIVYTPVEVVDFIIRSVEDILRDEFGSGLSDENVHIIDPFTGTGTFLVRLLQSGLIGPADLERKYRQELHANEIVLLAYYIAAINIEETYHALLPSPGTPEDPHQAPLPSPLAGEGPGVRGNAAYLPFEGIVLTDTFQLYESQQARLAGTFPENSARVNRQKAAPIRVVIANPPYSAGQGSQNDNNPNLPYVQLDARIRGTYAAKSAAPNVKNLYDSYIRAIRWASDRIEARGVVGLVTNGYFIDGNAMDGLRACLMDEFTSLYVFNLRGNARTAGEVRRTEAGNVFGGGARTPVAITLLVKNPDKAGQCELRYHDIGDYLSREEKLATISRFASIAGITQAKKWTQLQPNAQHDWINQRDKAFSYFLAIGDKAGVERKQPAFSNYSLGVGTNRDAWVYSFSDRSLATNVTSTIDYFNEQVAIISQNVDIPASAKGETRQALIDPLLGKDSKRIAWSSSLIAHACRVFALQFRQSCLTDAIYRPFCKQRMYYDNYLNHRVGQMPKLWPNGSMRNVAICTTGPGNRDAFGLIICDAIPDLHFADKSGGSQCFPLYLYEKVEAGKQLDFGAEDVVDGYRRREAITDWALATFRAAYGDDVTREDIFYYVYGILHSPEYRTRFAADLKKMLPRIPLTKAAADFRTFSQAGRDLAHWHLNYETIEPYPLTEHSEALPLDPDEHYLVSKMTFARKNKAIDKTTIVYNSHITLSGIPEEAYDYVVNGKPAIEWVMERYQKTRDKDSGIANDPNDWAREHHQPRYILDLVKRVVRVSLETVKIVRALPPLNERPSEES